jgi:hypothetical protein
MDETKEAFTKRPVFMRLAEMIERPGRLVVL